MIIIDLEDISSAIATIMEALGQQGTSPQTISGYRNSYNTFERYLRDNDITLIDENVCLNYINFRIGIKYESFDCVTVNKKANYLMRPLLLLLRYIEDGQINRDIRRTQPLFICPVVFRPEYERFCEELIYRGNSDTTVKHYKEKVQELLTYLTAQNIVSSEDITINAVDRFLSTYKGKAVKTVGDVLNVLKNYLTFLYDQGYTEKPLAPLLPKTRIPRNGSIPYGWSKTDIQKLLNAIDRNDPKGKRDYAVLLIAIRLGLRIGDIRKLKQTSINWHEKTIKLILSKTGQPIELPLLKDIGWAIIDYLKNGRPQTTSDCLFVRHRAPFNAIGGAGTFTGVLYRYIVKAGIEIPDKKRHGIHSLRNTLAGNMLEANAPLPIISEALGHQSVNTTSIYLKIDIEGLRKCAMDPEEVFAQ